MNSKRYGHVAWTLCALALTGAVVLAGCAASTVRITSEDAGKQVTLATGQTLEVTLSSNPTTGYSWQIADAADGVLEAVGDPAYVQDPGPALVGKGGAETFTFTAAKAGRGTLMMEYRRPWETTSTPEQVFEVPVQVD